MMDDAAPAKAGKLSRRAKSNERQENLFYLLLILILNRDLPSVPFDILGVFTARLTLPSISGDSA
jgi:hypothetical protein